MKYQEILEQVHELFKEREDYRLFISGHSLGGALATMFALEAAADNQIPKPVTCITSGAPKVGNLDFLLAFEELEREKKLRCVQVANDRDPVTMSPPDTWNPCIAVLFQIMKFRHVGLRIKLRESGYVLVYPMRMRTYLGILSCDCMNISRVWMFIIVFGFIGLFCFTVFFWLAIPVVSHSMNLLIKVASTFVSHSVWFSKLDHLLCL